MASFDDLNTIANNAGFQGRCLYALEVAAVNVMAEVNTTPVHGARVIFARQVLGGSVTGLRTALAVLTNSTIAGEAVLQTTPDYSIPDGDIQFAINSLYNALAGIGS